jgi:hypothetical protein
MLVDVVRVVDLLEPHAIASVHQDQLAIGWAIDPTGPSPVFPERRGQ